VIICRVRAADLVCDHMLFHIFTIADTRGSGAPAAEAEQLPETGNQDRPSEYLRARCPLCFGGQKCYDPGEM
jgi:hypothetical protein